MFIRHTYSGRKKGVIKMKKQEAELREELRILKLDLHEAYRRDDKTGVVAIQERIDGLEKIK